jgi:hypothetical protein
VLYAAISAALTIVTSGVKWLGHAADFSRQIRDEELYCYSAKCFHDVELNWYWMQFVGAYALRLWNVTIFILSVH